MKLQLSSPAILLLVIGWSCLAVLPIQVSKHSEFAQVAFTILSVFPILFATYNICQRFLIVIYNSNPDDDKSLSIFSFFCAEMSWVLGWSLIHMIFWFWGSLDPVTHKSEMFPHLHAHISAYDAWRSFISSSLMMCVGGPPPYFGDPDNSWLGLIMGFQAVFSLIITLCVLGVLAIVYRENNMKHPKSHKLAGDYEKGYKIYNLSADGQ